MTDLVARIQELEDRVAYLERRAGIRQPDGQDIGAPAEARPVDPRATLPFLRADGLQIPRGQEDDVLAMLSTRGAVRVREGIVALRTTKDDGKVYPSDLVAWLNQRDRAEAEELRRKPKATAPRRPIDYAATAERLATAFAAGELKPVGYGDGHVQLNCTLILKHRGGAMAAGFARSLCEEPISRAVRPYIVYADPDPP